jgi:integration host factor subunit alpha
LIGRTDEHKSSELSDDRIHAGMIPVGQAPRTSVTRADLIETVYRTVGLSRAESARLVELVLQEITDCFDRGETVKLSSFGTFAVRNKGPRPGRNPKTGIAVPIGPRRAIVFKPSATLRKRLASKQTID